MKVLLYNAAQHMNPEQRAHLCVKPPLPPALRRVLEHLATWLLVGAAFFLLAHFLPAQTSASLADSISAQPAANSETASAMNPLTAPEKKKRSEAVSIHTNPASTSLDAYLDRVRAANQVAPANVGSLWSDAGRLTRMSTDVRAMRPHDLVSVVVDESLAASTDGTVKNTRATTATSGVSGLIGTLHTGNALQNLLNQTSSGALNASGQSVTNSTLQTTLGGQVIEVLPNGMLVIEAARQVEFNQQTQTIVLRGLVRPEDISQQNQVLSTAISSLELEVKGRGIINDYTHRTYPLVRWLEKALVF